MAREDERARRLMTDAGRRRPGRADLRGGGRRSRAVPLLASRRSALRPHAQEVSIGRDRLHRPDLQDRRRRRPDGALRGGQRHPDPAGQGLGPEDLGARASPGAPACARRRSRSPASSPSCCTGCCATRPTFIARQERANGRLIRGDDTRFGRAITISPPGARSLRRDDGSVRPQCPQQRPRRLRYVRSAGGSSANTIEQRHRSTADRSKLRRSDDAQGIDSERPVTEADLPKLGQG